jgi:esterase/lipase
MMGDHEKVLAVSFKPYNRHGDILNTDIRFNTETKIKSPVLIFCHGLKGFKDWGCFPYMLESIAEEDIFTVSFNFSYNGTGLTGGDEQEFTRLDLFAKNTLSRELDDLEDIIRFLVENSNVFNYDLNRIYLMGHSRGGGIAIIKTSQNPKIKKLITLASVAIFDRYTDRLKKEWKEKGYIETMNTRTKQMMRFNYSYLQDLEKNSAKLDVLKAISKVQVPTLLVHGENDLSVDCTEAQTLYDFSNKKNTRLEIYKNTNHTFGAEHPFKGTSSILENVLKSIIDFLKS